MVPALIPVTVLTGFLGAGKTTLLNRLLADPALADTAVVINEFGDIGLDHLLVERAGEGVTLLRSGCLCCTIRGELIDTLQDLAERRDGGALPPFRRVAVETTGLADPVPILQTLAAHPGVASRYALDGVVTLVDAVNGEITLDRHEEARRQAALADRLLVTKADIAAPVAAAALRRRLAALNPTAPILDAVAATAGDLFGLDAGPASFHSAGRHGWLTAGRHGHDHRHHDVNRHDRHIRALTFRTDEAVDPARLDLFLGLVQERHGARLLRFKALVKAGDAPDRPLVLHAVRHVLHPPVRLARWPDQDRSSRFVFIVHDLAPGPIEALMAALLQEPRLDAPDLAALTANPLAF